MAHIVFIIFRCTQGSKWWNKGNVWPWKENKWSGISWSPGWSSQSPDSLSGCGSDAGSPARVQVVSATGAQKCSGSCQRVHGQEIHSCIRYVKILFSISTVIVLSFWTDRPGQTVQTQRSSLIRVWICTVCHSVGIVWTHYSMVEPHSSNFRVITTNFWGVRIFRKFTVCCGYCHRATDNFSGSWVFHSIKFNWGKFDLQFLIWVMSPQQLQFIGWKS